MTNLPRIIITPGEPAGIGPDVTVKIAQEKWPAELIAVCDPELLSSRAKLLNIPIKIIECDFKTTAEPHSPGTLKIIPVKLTAKCELGNLNIANSQYVLNCLQLATDACLQNQAHALVTGPVNKGVINDAGIAFTGHTEFLANYCNVPEVVMLFVANTLKVALATTHIPLSQVPTAITKNKLSSILRLFHSELSNRFAIKDPKIAVCGLNPHAGENGHLGREEIEVIEPVLQTLRTENKNIIGPLPADTIFTEKYMRDADAILAMYHDQALPVVKYLGFGHAVNVTLGLPIIRTSVDHGTAIDIAGTNQADAGSLKAAISLAIELCNPTNRSRLLSS